MASKDSRFLGHELRKPDAQGRIIIGKEHADDTFAIERLDNGDILLRPVVVIHKQEAWLFANPEAMESVKRGLQQAAEGNVSSLGSFAEFATDEDSEED
ncbi:MAG: hypothetical protein JST35_11920 [Armatimonadetes bacterium]|nr:hypothetical protein [Armatimonadota bacterium]